MNILIFLVKTIIVGILIHFFVYYIAPLLVYLFYIYFNIDVGFFMDFNNFYKSVVIICWFFYFLVLIFELLFVCLFYTLADLFCNVHRLHLHKL